MMLHQFVCNDQLVAIYDDEDYDPREEREHTSTLAFYPPHYYGDVRLPGQPGKMPLLQKQFGKLARWRPLYIEHNSVAITTDRPAKAAPVGFGVITEASATQTGIDPADREGLDQQLDWELALYNDWLSGDIYMYLILTPDGKEIVDGCGGIHGWDDAIREARYAAGETWGLAR